jgi:uncharacterized protein YegL
LLPEASSTLHTPVLEPAIGAETAPRPRVLPYYGLVAESGSLAGDPIDAVNDALPRLHEAIREDFDVDEILRFGLVAFGSQATIALPLCELSAVAEVPSLVAHGTANYGEAFRVLRLAIEADVPVLRAQGYDVFRPVVFMYADCGPDGGPYGPWLTDLTHLVDPAFAYRPHLVVFGLAGADRSVLARVATLKAYVADEGVDKATALREWATQLAQSMVASARSAGQGGSTLVIPPAPSGFREVALRSSTSVP